MPSPRHRTLPALPYGDWEETKATVHLVSQIVGKVKMAHHPKQSHWWHATLRVTPRGVSTHTIPTPEGSFELELDVHDLRLAATTSDGRRDGFSLAGTSVADVYRETMTLLERLDHPTEIVDRPYDNPHSETPFPEDDEHSSWDHQAILSWWRTLVFTDEVFRTFAGRSYARTSPVQLFWHSFDMAVTRFTGRRSPSFGEGDTRSDIEAYSHEVLSFGYWPGDPEVRFPAYYSYTAPEPDGITEQALRPDAAWWQELPSSHMALLRYDDVRTSPDPRGTLLSFMESAYRAGASLIDHHDAEAHRTRPLWDELDERFPRTAGRERR